MTILAAIGEEQHAQNVVSVAYDLAETYGDTLIALHVMPKEEFNEHKQAINSTPGYTHLTIDQEESSAKEFSREVVDAALDGFDRERVEVRGRVGEPANKVLDEAEYVDPRFVVIGAKHRSPVGKALFGSTAQKILLDSDTPVVTTTTQ
ncbi:universal stress protein [Haloferax sp. S1W]|uniref:universal stress protein n=1 Tax=Haloferax sp. S1W TaxID=3377110 RepID=UPI0037CB5E9C